MRSVPLRLARALVGLGLVGALGACAGVVDVGGARRALLGSGSAGIPPLTDDREVDLPAPDGLDAMSGELRAVALSWNPLLDGRVAGYAVERAPAAEGPFTRVGAVAGHASVVFVDRGADDGPRIGRSGAASGLSDGTSYFYRVRAYDARGALAREASSVVSATTAAPPDPPEGLRAFSGQPREAPLSWRPPADPHVAGYVVYRSPSSHGPFEPIAELDGRFQTGFVDRGLGDLRVFYYRVAARNTAGGVGEPSEAVRAVTKPEPLPPLGLRVAARGLGVNRIAWEPNVEPDLAGYRLMRLREGADQPELVAVLPPDRMRADDWFIGADERVSYSAVAFDDDGLESAPAEPIEVKSEGYHVTATARADGVHLAWDPRPEENFERARISRLGFFGSSELGVSESDTFVDRTVEPGERYRYVVVLERRDTSQAPPSSPVEIRVPGE